MGGGSDGGAVVDVRNGLCSKERVPLLVLPLPLPLSLAAAALVLVLVLVPAPKLAPEEGEAAVVEVGK